MRSHFGCSSCKRRKLKCDELRPVCGPCKKSSRSCNFPNEFIFSVVDRPSRLRKLDKDTTRLRNEVSSFEENQIWIDIPKNVSFVGPWVANEPCTRFPTLPTEPLAKQPNPVPERSEPHGQGPTQAFFTRRDDVSSTFDDPTSSQLMLDPFPVCEGSSNAKTRTLGQSCADNCMIALRLIRHYKEGPSRWMDLFDTAGYYTNVVPIRATSSPLLKSSICALSAKHMHRLQSADGDHRHPCRVALEDGSSVDWLFHSTEYYLRSINHLQAAVRNEKIGPDSSGTDRERECIFTAITLLSMYELMDKPGTAWRAHLSALPLFCSTSGHSRVPAHSGKQLTICRPVFWSLARQDLLCAFISETHTRLSLDDAHLWNSAGLNLAIEEGSSYSRLTGPVVMGSATNIEEDKRANEMIWLLSNIMNFLTQADSPRPEDYAHAAEENHRVSVTQEQLLERWKTLDTELQNWLSRLPSSFTPTARTLFVQQGVASRSTDQCFADFVQIWYEIPLCAAAMLSYHMARILLLVNRPHRFTVVRSSIISRLRYYEYTRQESIRHAREICGICLANPPDAVLLHSLEPLYVAGQALQSSSERKVVISMLKDIQKNIGWSTSYHVTKLQSEWQEGGDWVVNNDII